MQAFTIIELNYSSSQAFMQKEKQKARGPLFLTIIDKNRFFKFSGEI